MGLPEIELSSCCMRKRTLKTTRARCCLNQLKTDVLDEDLKPFWTRVQTLENRAWRGVASGGVISGPALRFGFDSNSIRFRFGFDSDPSRFGFDSVRNRFEFDSIEVCVCCTNLNFLREHRQLCSRRLQCKMH